MTAFNSAVKTSIEQIGSGERVGTSPYSEQAYDNFEEGLVQGRFVQLIGEVASNMDGTVTPNVIGIAERNITGETGVVSYTNLGEAADTHANVLEFGRASVDVVTGQTPVRGGAVSVNNVAGVDAGKALATGGDLLEDVVFVKELKTDVWSVTLKKYMA